MHRNKQHYHKAWAQISTRISAEGPSYQDLRSPKMSTYVSKIFKVEKSFKECRAMNGIVGKMTWRRTIWRQDLFDFFALDSCSCINDNIDHFMKYLFVNDGARIAHKLRARLAWGVLLESSMCQLEDQHRPTAVPCIPAPRRPILPRSSFSKNALIYVYKIFKCEKIFK